MKSHRGCWPAKMQLEPLLFQPPEACGGVGGVKGQLSQKPQRILLGEDPWDSSLKPRHHGQVSQVCPAAAPGPEYIYVFIGCCGTTSPQNPRPFPQSTLHLMLMFEWAYWSSTTLFLRVQDGRTLLQEVVSFFYEAPQLVLRQDDVVHNAREDVEQPLSGLVQ